MDINELAKEVWLVGREQQRAPAKYVFSIARREDGGISLRDVQEGVSDRERTLLMQHFGRPIERHTGGSTASDAWEAREMVQPGSPEHFVAAVHRLPPPFILVPSKG